MATEMDKKRRHIAITSSQNHYKLANVLNIGDIEIGDLKPDLLAMGNMNTERKSGSQPL